jgi:Fic/DOC family
MPEDLPIYSNTMLRTGLQFQDLDRFKGRDVTAVWEKSDRLIEQLEGASEVSRARAELKDYTREELLRSHGILFSGRIGAGSYRTIELPPMYRGQDCAPPEFIGRSLTNLETWLKADSFHEIHPIEKCALTITRILDIWPFEFGNLTAAIVFANQFLKAAGYTPFFVQPEYRNEFEKTIASSMTIEMQPLINAIYQTVKREMQILGQ